MPTIRRSLLTGLAAATLLLGACSDDESTTTETTAAPSETTAPGDGTAAETTTTAAGDDHAHEDGEEHDHETAELPGACDALTAEEFTAVTGTAVTAEVDEMLPTACNYLDDGGSAVAILTVDHAPAIQTLLDGFVEYPPPGATFEEVSGIGTAAVVAGPPEGRAVVIVGDLGYDLSRGGSPLPADQLEELLRSIVAE